MVDEFDIYLYNDGNGWQAVNGYTFVEPYDDDNRTGIVRYSQKNLVGKKIIYGPESEYEFKFDKKRYYRIRDINISAVL
jgi:CRISPR/Cas system-associated protein Cas5 (RAMP superfamily)